MEKEKISIEIASPDNARELLEIYAPYVEKTAISFEYDVPGVTEFAERIEKTLQKYPYLMVKSQDKVLGYACTHPFVGRAAYDWSAEVTIYLREDQKGKGIGRKLYQALEEISRLQNILNLNACIGYPEYEDEYLTKNSVEFHTHMGYRMVGTFHKSGYKFGRWYDMVWMEKIIGVHGPDVSPVVCFPDLDLEKLKKLGITNAIPRFHCNS